MSEIKDQRSKWTKSLTIENKNEVIKETKTTKIVTKTEARCRLPAAVVVDIDGVVNVVNVGWLLVLGMEMVLAVLYKVYYSDSSHLIGRHSVLQLRPWAWFWENWIHSITLICAAEAQFNIIYVDIVLNWKC